MLGKPEYTLGQIVEFKKDRAVKRGKIIVVDARGTFGQNEEPSFDILVEAETMVYKHIRESQIIKPVE